MRCQSHKNVIQYNKCHEPVRFPTLSTCLPLLFMNVVKAEAHIIPVKEWELFFEFSLPPRPRRSLARERERDNGLGARGDDPVRSLRSGVSGLITREAACKGVDLPWREGCFYRDAIVLYDTQQLDKFWRSQPRINYHEIDNLIGRATQIILDAGNKSGRRSCGE